MIKYEIKDVETARLIMDELLDIKTEFQVIRLAEILYTLRTDDVIQK